MYSAADSSNLALAKELFLPFHCADCAVSIGKTYFYGQSACLFPTSNARWGGKKNFFPLRIISQAKIFR